VNIARKIGRNRYKHASVRTPQQTEQIQPQQGSVFNMIWSWAINTFAPETLEEQLQYSTQYFPIEPLSWFQGWWINSLPSNESSTSSTLAFGATDSEIPEPPKSPLPPCPPAPPMCTAGTSTDHQRKLLNKWFRAHRIRGVPPIPDGCVEIYVLQRPSHTYPLEVIPSFTHHDIEQHCWIPDRFYGGWILDTVLMDMHLNNWDDYFPPVHKSWIHSLDEPMYGYSEC
jgi:hypothetical protein